MATMFPAFFVKLIAVIESFFMAITVWANPAPVKSTAAISFDANPSTGYTWVCKMDPTGVVKVASEHFTQPVLPKPVAGAPGIYTFILAPVADGKTKLTFYYMRTWEGTASAAKTVKYNVTVKDGMICLGNPVSS